MILYVYIREGTTAAQVQCKERQEIHTAQPNAQDTVYKKSSALARLRPVVSAAALSASPAIDKGGRIVSGGRVYLES